jgi:hypothetical protein
LHLNSETRYATARQFVLKETFIYLTLLCKNI